MTTSEDTPRLSRISARVLLVLLVATIPASIVGGGQQEAVATQETAAVEPPPDGGLVVRLELDSIIHPVAEELVREAIAEAEQRRARALVIELNTPGGMLTTTRNIASQFLQSETPIVVYVSPAGSQAASAGFFLLMAADVAAMAPGTNTGAAHPVDGGGQNIEGDMRDKVEQDTAAWIRSLAAERGRNPELAESAVIESRSFSADEALAEGIIDLLADDLESLLTQLDGRTVDKGGELLVLRTAEASIDSREITRFQSLRSTIARPDVALALAGVGSAALMIELYSPGAILPGVVGAICLILAGYSFSILPVSWTGIALLILAALLFGLEIKVQSFGVLTAGGIVSLVLGSLFLFRSPDPAIRVSMQMIVAMVTVAVAVVVLMTTVVVRAQRSGVQTGKEGLTHERGIARTAIDPRGKVSIHGEIWDAVSKTAIAPGDEIEVVAVDGLTLEIKPKPSSS